MDALSNVGSLRILTHLPNQHPANWRGKEIGNREIGPTSVDHYHLLRRVQLHIMQIFDLKNNSNNKEGSLYYQPKQGTNIGKSQFFMTPDQDEPR